MVEQGPEKPCVGGSIPPPGTTYLSSVYVLVNAVQQTYTGVSANFEERFKEHNNPLGIGPD